MNAIKKRLGRLKLPSFKLRQFGFGGNQFAAERFGERGLNQFVGAGGGGGDAGLDLVRQPEQRLDPADDLVLLRERTPIQRVGGQFFCIYASICPHTVGFH